MSTLAVQSQVGRKPYPRAYKALDKKYRNKLYHSSVTPWELQIKRLYNDKKLNESKTNMPKNAWLLNDIINKKKPNVKSNTTFKAENQEIFDPIVTANKFCQYFSSIGPNLAKIIRSMHHIPQKLFIWDFQWVNFSWLGNGWRNYRYCKPISARQSSWLW